MKKQLQGLQEQRDFLRSQLKGEEKTEGQMDQQKLKTLKSLDGLFLRLCEGSGIKLSKQGRLL